MQVLNRPDKKINEPISKQLPVAIVTETKRSFANLATPEELRLTLQSIGFSDATFDIDQLNEKKATFRHFPNKGSNGDLTLQLE